MVVVFWAGLCVIFSFIASVSGLPVTAASTRRIAPPSRRLRAESEVTRSDVVIVDGDNVRGKLHFRWSTSDLAKSTAAWASELGLTGRILLFYDHGDIADALWTDDGLAVAFSGHISADDQIVAAVRSLSCEHGAVVTVATADSELRLRCAKAVRCRRHLNIVSPVALIAALQESALRDAPSTAQAGLEVSTSKVEIDTEAIKSAQLELSSLPNDGPLSFVEQQRLRSRKIECDLRSVRKQLRNGMGQKMRSKLLRRLTQLELAYWKTAHARGTGATGATLSNARSAEEHEAAGAWQDGSTALRATAGVDALSVAAMGQAKRPTRGVALGRELTSDRAFNAEAFRQQLRAAGASLTPPAGVLSAPSLAHYLAKQFGAAHAEMSVLAQPRSAPLAAGSAAAASPVRELSANARLLALDVGERQGGFALFDAASGALLTYGGLSGSPLLSDCTLAQLRHAISATGGTLERLVLEGNSQMCQRWRAALFASNSAGGDEGAVVADDESGVDVVSVTAQSWRASMLTRREQQSGKLSAKEAARRIARQLLARSSLADAAGARLDTNAAEAICVGHWACAFLWRLSDGNAGAESGERIDWPWVLVERTIAGEVILR